MSELTEVPSVVEPALAADARQKRSSSPLLIVGTVIMFALGVALVAVRLPYFVFEPGGTFATEEIVVVEGAEEFPSPEGEVQFVTVTRRRVSPLDYAVSWLQDSDELVHEDLVLGDQSVEEQRTQNAAQMVSSQNAAVVAALSQLGYDVFDPAGALVLETVEGSDLSGAVGFNDVVDGFDGAPITTVEELMAQADATAEGQEVLLAFRLLDGSRGEVVVTVTDDTGGFLGIMSSVSTPDDGGGAQFDDVLPDGPAAGILEAGDVITGLAGQPIDTFADLVEGLGMFRSGDVVSIEFIRPAEGPDVLQREVTLGMRSLERLGLSRAVTQLVDDPDLPISIMFDTQDIGGPSAGLAFTLTILDVLSPGELTGGAEVVATGTIARNGQVGPIGGVHQKAFAAEDADADVFIVPRANLDEARAAVPDLRIEPVDTLEDALAILEEFGGNADELPDFGEGEG